MSVEAAEPGSVALLSGFNSYRKLRKSQKVEAEQPDDIIGTIRFSL